jgi:hypothetical protein
LNRIESKGKEIKIDVGESGVSELIESLKIQGRTLKRLQQILGIEEFPIPIIGGEEN